MGANIYEYPQVPRSSQTQINETAPQQTSQSRHSRFSWVETPAEAKAYTWQHNGRSNAQRQPDIPPLPQLPEHLHGQELPPGSNTVSRTDEQSPQPTAQPYQSPIPQQPAPAYSQSANLPVQQYASVPTSHYHRQDSQTTHQQPLQQPPTQPQHQERQYSQDSKPEHAMQYTHMPPQSAQRDPPPKETFPIGPDENPLSPTTPTKQQLPTTANNTTNIPVLRPSDPIPGHATATATTFSPTPHPIHGGTWQHSLCSCAAPSICLTSLFCPCVTYGRTQYRLSQRSAHKDPTNMLGYSACNGSCVAFGVLCGVNAILAAIQKTRVRKAYGMDRALAGGLSGDLVKGACCCCCSVAQDEKEVRWREEEGRRAGGGGGHGARVSNEGYAPVGGMTFSPPPPRDG